MTTCESKAFDGTTVWVREFSPFSTKVLELILLLLEEPTSMQISRCKIASIFNSTVGMLKDRIRRYTWYIHSLRMMQVENLKSAGLAIGT